MCQLCGASACSDPKDETGSRLPAPADAGARGGQGGLDLTGSSAGTGGMRAPPRSGSGPGGCVLPDEVNEFGLPLCEPPGSMDASTPGQPQCEHGFDELGRPICLADGGVPETPPPPSCSRGGLCQQLLLAGGGQLDLLFMIDNSGSMREEQQALVREMPQLIDVLTSGDLDGDGVQDFPALLDLHIGVVSSDMAAGGVLDIDKCEQPGDDGVLRNTPSVEVTGCAASYPTFLSFEASQVDPNQAAADFACIGSLGTNGCGFEQQLESVLKAVTPSSSDRRFVSPSTTESATGQADRLNAGFLRRDSLVALVLVTDEDDCSAREPRLFWPDHYLDPLEPLYGQPLNLRCFLNPDNLFDVVRYATGLQEIRPPGSNLVLFAAIVGVPPELVDASARAGIDFGDSAARDGYYDAILAHPAMQEVPDTTDPVAGYLVPSCVTDSGRAYPPRRITQVARAFGENAVVQSICQSSFAPALEPIVERITRSLTAACLDRTFERDAEGKVACDVIWELPAPGTPGASLALCDERAYLSTPPDRDQRSSADGRTRCLVDQLAIAAGDAGQPPAPAGSGWYYDDFSSEAMGQCGGTSDQRVAFTADVSAPADVRVFVDCAP